MGVKKQKCLIGYITGNEAALESQFPRQQTFSESAEPLSRNQDPNLALNEYVYAICCRLEVADEVISGGNVKTTENCAVLHF